MANLFSLEYLEKFTYSCIFLYFFFSQNGNKQFQIRKHQLNMVTVTDPNTYLHISAP